ncbi:hypothetical protein [Pseudotabrizicola algicola]|uniref:Uncharacterized protein n=1 Tax=Pseudotabrizicola algicola TaxID=2709381 RepID=A0A6B3RHA1_9RHOB|nr:hypothetical protein [Pseudotabrizicola algicola]NEX45407.1 hypothetical protein [Pseudotabrizicola algicola]
MQAIADTQAFRQLTTDIPLCVAALRRLAPRCQAAARLDLFRACAMLSAQPDIAAAAYAEALLRGLAVLFGRPPVLHQPAAPELSFDERWIASLVAAALRGDDSSLRFLLASRLPRHAWRQIGWLAGQFALRQDRV